MRVIGTFEDRTEWLTARRQGLGASDIAAVLGLSPYATSWSVYVDKVGAVPLDDEATEQMEWGQDLEQIILNRWQKRTGLHAGYRGLLVAHDEHPWMMASLDALAFDVPAGGGLHEGAVPPVAVTEAKQTQDWSWDDGIPLHYRAQAQWQMAVTGLPKAVFAVSHRGVRLGVYELEADYDDHAALTRIASEFWHDNVQAQVPPSVEAGDNERLARVYPEAVDSEVDVDAAAVRELVAVKAEQKILEARRDRLEAQLKATLAESNVGTVDGEKAVSWKQQSDRTRFDADGFVGDNPFLVRRFTVTETVERLDTKAIAKEEPDLFEKYDRPIRVFRTHKIKEQSHAD